VVNLLNIGNIHCSLITYISENNVTKSRDLIGCVTSQELSRSNPQEYTAFCLYIEYTVLLFFSLHTLLMSNHITNIYWIAFWKNNTLISW